MRLGGFGKLEQGIKQIKRANDIDIIKGTGFVMSDKTDGCQMHNHIGCSFIDLILNSTGLVKSALNSKTSYPASRACLTKCTPVKPSAPCHQHFQNENPCRFRRTSSVTIIWQSCSNVVDRCPAKNIFGFLRIPNQQLHFSRSVKFRVDPHDSLANF